MTVDDAVGSGAPEGATLMVWRADAQGRRDYFDAAWRAFTGRTSGALVADGWLDSVHEEDREACLALERERFAAGEAFERTYRLRAVDGAYRAVRERVLPYGDADADLRGFVGSCACVDELDLWSAAAMAETFFERSLDNLCVAGFDGRFRQVNPAWSRTLGWSREELLARPIIDLIHPDDREATLAERRRLHQGEQVGPIVNRYLTKDGGYRWFEWRSISHYARGLVYATARDITAQREAEDRLREAKEREEKLQQQLIFADRMASVGTLAAGVAHEINNPLGFVVGNVALMIEALESERRGGAGVSRADLLDMAQDVRVGAERIWKIVKGLKTFSRAETEQLGVVDVRGVIEQSIDMVFNEIRHRARLVKDYAEIPPVDADEARLGQVFINLLINAAQAIPEGRAEDHEIRILTSTDAKGRAVVSVRDTGAGIPAAIVGRIFDPFFTTKPVGVGTGLGLSICHNIVTGLGGELTVMTHEGLGTTLTVALPPSRTVVARAAAPPVAPDPAVDAPARVMVVDDEPSIGTMLIRVLSAHDVTTVTRARDALEMLAVGAEFDVIFSDLMMPQVSGMDFYDAIAARFPHLTSRVVFLSGGAFTPAAADFLKRVTNPRVDKPFAPAEVREVVRRLLETQGRRPS